MPGPLYRSVGVASTFSPRFLQVLSEANRIRERFGARLSLIYVGTRDAATVDKFAEALRQLRMPADSVIHYEEGEPATAILRAAANHKIDLVVAGALEKQVVLRPFLGNVARQLVREAVSSVILFVHPEINPKPMRKIVFVADFSEAGRRAFRHVLHLAAEEKCERLYAIRVYTTFDAARASRRPQTGDGRTHTRTLSEEEMALEEFVLSIGHTEVPIEARVVQGNTAYAASDFVQSVEADLLAVPAPAARAAGKQRPAQIGWITDVIPCNLWVIR
jgi:nucleotide-binding universal stress UspA family protein